MKPYSTTPEKSVKEDWIQQPNWAQGGISPGYAQMVNFDKASAFVDPTLLELQQFGGNRISMDMVAPGGTYEFGSGSLSAPGIRWAADTDTGFYWESSGVFSVSINGTKEVEFNSSGIALANLTATRVLFAGTSGQITDDSALTFDSTNDFLSIAGTAGKQLRLGYDSSMYIDFTVGATGGVQITPSHNGLDHVAFIYNNNGSGTLAVTQQNTGSSASAAISITTPSSASDAYLVFNAQASWSIGTDNSDSDKFKICNFGSLGTNDYFTIDTSGNVTFSGTITTGLTASRLVATDGSSTLASVSNLASWIAGTSDQVTVTDDTDGTITLSLPQSIATSSSPTFTGLTLSGLTATRLVASDGSDVLVSTSLNSWVAGTANQITVTDDLDGTITLSTPQDIGTGSSPSFTGLTVTGLSASRLVSTNGSDALTSTDISSWIAGTSNQITVTDDADGTVTLSTPQDIHTSATPRFLRMGLGAAAGAAVTLLLSVSDALTSPVLDITQASTGDAGLRFAIGSTASFAIGVDNSASDAFKVSYAASGSAEFGTNDYFTIFTSGIVHIGSGGTIADFRSTSITFNDARADSDLLIKGDNSAVLFKTDAGLDAVQIGNATAGDLADFRSTVIVFNEGGADKDFRVETDDESYCLMVEGTLNNVVMCANAEPGFNSMDGGVFIAEANVVPTGNPTGGGYLYVESGALKYRGTGGTITTMGPA